MITFVDLNDFIKHAMERYPEIVDEAVDRCPANQQHLNERIDLQPRPVTTSETLCTCGKLLAGVHSLSEWSYKATRTLLATKNVFLATYDKAVAYLKSLDIGKSSSGRAMTAQVVTKPTTTEIDWIIKFYLSFPNPCRRAG